MESIEYIRKLVDFADFQQDRSRRLYRDIADLQVKIALIKEDSTDPRYTIVLDSTFSWLYYFIGEIELELDILDTHTTHLHNWLERRINSNIRDSTTS